MLTKGERNRKILELGPGKGSILFPYTKMHTLVSFDINPQLLQFCKETGAYPICGNCDITLPFKDESFEMVVTIDSIEHFLYRNKIMEEIHRILKPGGIVMHFTPPYDSWIWNVAEKIHNFLIQTKSDHISPFTKESMQYLMNKYFVNIHVEKKNFNLTMYAYGEKAK